MIKKWSILLFAALLLTGCSGQADNTEKTSKTITEKSEAEKDKKTTAQEKITVEPMKLTANEKNLLEALSDESFEAMTVKGLKDSNKSVSLIGMHYKDGKLVEENTKDVTINLHQNGVDNSVNFIYQLDDEKDDLLKVTYSLWKDKEQNELTKLSTSLDFKQDVGGNTTITESDLFHISPGVKKLISTTITTGMNYEFSGLTGSEKNLKKELKDVKQAYLVYLQLDK
ncbi:hypothetical protein [Bacillus sp. 179-C3.3 HS]|uniref:hypothetical protein n=1 Tax=Bacillus sp. 179-C3.3 HS TaxID=3232162 RepID=UPI0039A3DF56